MARKAIRGYSEKSYYENSTFKGVVATTDPLNEGNFAHMVNFDISDTGNSLKPRCGFLTTDFLLHTSEGYDTLKLKADTTIYFYEPSIQKYIFVDFSTFRFTSEELGDYTYSLNAYAVEFVSKIVEGHTNKHFIAERISNVDIDDIFSLFVLNEEDDYKNMRLALTRTKFKQTLAEHITDSYLISKYIIKHAFNDYTPYTWIEVYYRKEGSSYEDVTYTDDTVVVSFVNTEDTVSIDPNNRNIASTKSIIPEPLQKIYPADSKDLAYNQFPFIYAKDNTTGKYLTTTSKDLDITLTPHFLLKEPNDKRVWAYTYSFISTRYGSDLSSDNVWYSDVYTLKDNINIEDVYNNALIQEAERVSIVDEHIGLVHLDSLIDTVYPDNIASMYFYWMYASALATPKFEQFYGARTLYSGTLPHKVNDDNTTDIDYDKADIGKYLTQVNMKPYEYFNSDYFKNSVLIYVVPNVTDEKINTCQYSASDFSMFLLRLSYSIEAFKETNCFTYNRSHKFVQQVLNTSNANIGDFISTISTIDCSSLRFIIVPFSEMSETFNVYKEGATNPKAGLQYYTHYAVNTGVLFEINKPKTLYELCEYLRNNNHTNLVWRFMQTGTYVKIPTDVTINLSFDTRAHQIVPNADTLSDTRTKELYYYIYTADTPNYGENIGVGNFNENGTGSYLTYTDHLKQYFFNYIAYNVNTTTSLPILAPIVYNPDRTSATEMLSLYRCPLDVTGWIPHSISTSTSNKDTHFTLNNGLLTLDMLDSKLNDLQERGYFDNGVNLSMSLVQCLIPETLYDMLMQPYDMYNPTYLRTSTSLMMSTGISFGLYPTYIPEYLTEQPTDIRTSNKWCVFHSEQGDRLVTWIANKVYVSEANDYYYFKESNKYAYPEKVLKVIQFKNTLLVFTTINLYSIYPYEDTIMVESGKDDEGNTQYVQNKVIYYATLPVLYNLMLTEQYIDAIQVFNQMVLFYSADGQLFMIKPTATIDNDTKFTIQYFNKSVNDILLNYVDYMNNRLIVYGAQDLIQDKTQVKIKVQVNINYIKIFYMYKDYTYILVYDVINNYFYVYDTMSFSNVDNILFTEDGDVYVTPTTLNANEDYLFFTIKNYVPNEMDNNNDEAIYHNFVDTPILSELDTGVLNLNNHLKKRFRDLYTVYKNISSTYLDYEVETFIDDIPAQVVLGDSLTVKATEVNGDVSYNYDCVEIKNTNDILKYNALFDFSLFTSNKMLTYYTNIPCLGKQFRLRLRFNSKGVYKLQSYGITFKEHQI